MGSLARVLNALMALTIVAILCGAYFVQFLLREQPCPLCLLQRLYFIGAASGPLLNLRFGIRPMHYGMTLLACVLGGSVSLRQISLHVCPGFPEFGEPVWGLNLYSWAFLVFASCVLAVAMLLCIYEPEKGKKEMHRMNVLDQIAFFSVVTIALINVITTLQECGLGACKG